MENWLFERSELSRVDIVMNENSGVEASRAEESRSVTSKKANKLVAKAPQAAQVKVAAAPVEEAVELKLLLQKSELS